MKPCRQQFQLSIIQGDRAVIYPIMGWLLPRISDLQKRAYLARYLVNIEVPEEFFQDQGIDFRHNSSFISCSVLQQ